MFFHVRELEVRARDFDVEIPPGVIEFFDPKLRQAGPIRAAGRVELVSGPLGEIRVKGHAEVLMEADCDRCLDAARLPIGSDFELYYRPVSEGYGEDSVIDRSEAEMGFYEGDGIELNDVLRENILLSLPMQRLCNENCKGICPHCGQNRNQQPCLCQTAAADDRWAALRQFK